MDNEQPHQELVKCVLVGDTAVGKTRLICARACNKHVSLSQLLSTHVPTVWAIDQYRIYKDVLERSWEVVDGVNVSLRLWDTFGDHDKDRRFAYGRSDVILLCFSIASPISLRNCKAMWYQEIRKFCPDTPVILVGCKNDLRYMYRDETYLSFFGDRSPFVRAALKSDLVMPDEARAVAKELGIDYYETSVFTYFGVNEVFENAIRAALIARRQQRFWMTNLKKVQKPIMQAPFRPPKPPPPEVTVVVGTYRNDMYQMLSSRTYTDLVLLVGQTRFSVHKFMLASASNAFFRLLTIELSDMGGRSSSESSMVSSTFGDCPAAEFNDDTEYLIRNKSKPVRMWEQLKRRSSYQALPLIEQKNPMEFYKDLQHAAFNNIRVIHTENERGVNVAQTVVTFTKAISSEVIQQCLKFVYTGAISPDYKDIKELAQAAELLELPELTIMLSKPRTNPEEQYLSKTFNQCLEKLCIGDSSFSDVTFELDDGQMKAHRAILVARCDVMRAMLNGDFREAHSSIIPFPGVTIYTFHKLLCYIYLDEIPPISADKCLNLLELANRLCLPRLLNLVECRIIEDLTIISQHEITDTVNHCLKLLESVKLYNAHQLAEWCMSYLCVNYNIICKYSIKGLKALHQENQEYLREHRWPPVWYLKDFDIYQRCMNEMNKEITNGRKRSCNDDNGCLCFSGVFSWLTGKTSRGPNSAQQQKSTESQIFTSNANSINQIDLEQEVDLNL